MRVLIVSFGSIGKRHYELAKDMGHDVAIVSQHEAEAFRDIVSAVEKFKPTHVLIASPTHQHYDDMMALITVGFQGAVLVEKPIFKDMDAIPEHQFKHLSIAYNFRFHPIIQDLKQRLDGETIISVQSYVGQYLPDWRPNQDYRTSYSASKAKGGGVLRDLSHELDYLAWLFGDWATVSAMGGKTSALEIDSDDNWAIIGQNNQGTMLSLQLNYLDKIARRFMVIHSANASYYIDFIANKLYVNDEEIIFSCEKNDSYRKQLHHFLSGDMSDLCNAKEAHHVMAVIHAIEESAKQGKWINL